MDEATQKQVLNENLRVPQEKFGYEHYEEPNEKFDFLTKYLFKWTEGFAMETGSVANTTMVSDLNSGRKMPAIKDAASSSRDSPGTAGYQEAARVQASLRSCKNRLTKVHEDLKQNLLLAQKRAVIEKVTDLQLKSEVAEKGVELARDVLSLQLGPKSECEDPLAKLREVLLATQTHEAAGKAAVKQCQKKFS